MKSISTRETWITWCFGFLALSLLASAARGDFLVTSALTDEILRYSDDGARLGAFVNAGAGGLNAPMAMTWGPDGDLYVGSGNSDRMLVKRFDGRTGGYLGNVYALPAIPTFGLAFAPNGDLLISSRYRVHRADLVNGTGIDIPMDYTVGKLLITHDGNVLVGSGNKGGAPMVIKRIDLSNNQVSEFAVGGGLRGPFSLEYGPDGMIYSLNVYPWSGDQRSTRIYRFTEDGDPLGRWADTAHDATADLMFIGDRLWIAGILDSQLTLLDSQTGQIIKSVPGGSWNWDLLHMPEPGSFVSIALLAGFLGGSYRMRRRSLL